MVLDRWPDNFFAETEQVAFCPSHIVPGIDFSDNPLLQGRLFDWAPFRSTKAAIKLHTLLDLRGAIPAFIHISDGKLHDVNVLDRDSGVRSCGRYLT